MTEPADDTGPRAFSLAHAAWLRARATLIDGPDDDDGLQVMTEEAAADELLAAPVRIHDDVRVKLEVIRGDLNCSAADERTLLMLAHIDADLVTLDHNHITHHAMAGVEARVRVEVTAELGERIAELERLVARGAAMTTSSLAQWEAMSHLAQLLEIRRLIMAERAERGAHLHFDDNGRPKITDVERGIAREPAATLAETAAKLRIAHELIEVGIGGEDVAALIGSGIADLERLDPKPAA